MKKYRIVAVFVMILLMGCGSAQNGKMKESSTMKESEETISIKTYDWNHARIKDMVDMQCFGNGPIVQNENYIFYPKDGYKVARVDKEKKDEKIIYEFTPSKEEGVGVHITLGELRKNLENCENPRSHGKGLTANRSGEWRYRVGDYRILAQIDDNKIIILLLNIGHRRDIYD